MRQRVLVDVEVARPAGFELHGLGRSSGGRASAVVEGISAGWLGVGDARTYYFNELPIHTAMFEGRGTGQALSDGKARCAHSTFIQLQKRRK